MKSCSEMGCKWNSCHTPDNEETKPERRPLERKNGKYVHDLSGLEQYADIVAEELADMFPEVDLIDIEFLFRKKLGLAFIKQNNYERRM